MPCAASGPTRRRPRSCLESARSFKLSAALDPKFPADFREDLSQILQFGVFVVTQKLILYRVLEEAGPRRSTPFHLDPLTYHAHPRTRRRSRPYSTARSRSPSVGPKTMRRRSAPSLSSIWFSRSQKANRRRPNARSGRFGGNCLTRSKTSPGLERFAG